MKYSFILKSAIAGFFLAAFTLNVQAQKIEESDIKLGLNKINNSTERLKALEPVVFKYDTEKYKALRLPEGNQYGFKASSVEAVFPEIVYEASKTIPAGKNQTTIAKYDEVEMKNLIPVLVAAFKEQQAEIKFLKEEVERMKIKSAQLN